MLQDVVVALLTTSLEKDFADKHTRISQYVRGHSNAVSEQNRPVQQRARVMSRWNPKAVHLRIDVVQFRVECNVSGQLLGMHEIACILVR